MFVFMALTTKQKLKLAGSAILAILATVIVLQNTETVETKILFISVAMPRALLLLVATALGFGLGSLVTLIIIGKKKKDS